MHFAYSNKSVTPSIEKEILTRRERFQADGFIGFYSTFDKKLIEAENFWSFKFYCVGWSLIKEKAVGIPRSEPVRFNTIFFALIREEGICFFPIAAAGF